MVSRLSVVDATQRELDGLPVGLAGSALAATALSLAQELDTCRSAHAKAMCARALLDVLNRLSELAAAGAERTGIVHDIRAGRANRLRVARGAISED